MNIADNSIAPFRNSDKTIAKVNSLKGHDSRTDIIVIGKKPNAKTYRALLEKRAAAGARGKSWLFVEHSDFAKDSAYRERLTQYQRHGIVHKVDVAFGGNTTVEDKLLSKSHTVFQWIEGGAEFYVYGDRHSNLANDIAAVLSKIVQENIRTTAEQAEVYVRKLKAEGRFYSDVDLELGTF